MAQATIRGQPLQNPVSTAYAAQVQSQHFQSDGAQILVARKLDDLCVALALQPKPGKAGVLGWLFGARDTSGQIRGQYIWGSVGRGKTMLMDLFFDLAPLSSKRRVHFNAFMSDVHARIHAWRQEKRRGQTTGIYRGDDPIVPVAEALAADAILLCFDEFSVTDIADAMILGRLFQALWAQGVVIVATSNVAPNDLYRDGLNRALFLPFIALIGDHMDVLRLDAARDFRLEKLSSAPVYFVPADAAAHAALDAAFAALAAGTIPAPMRLPLLGREIFVPAAAASVARFNFADLCEKPMGSADYLALAQRFHTIILDEIPVIPADARNVAKRFILLIDTLYDARVKLLASAAAEPESLYRAAQGREAFEFARTVSRLVEMRSQDYLQLAHGRSDSRGSGNTSGLAET